MPETVIIGAGPAGLTAAYELNKLGERSVILEADHQVGGISRTVNYQGFRFDIGGHRFFTKVDYIRQLWDEILGEDFLERPRLSRIYYNNRFFDYPLRMGNTLKQLGPMESLLVGLSYVKTRIRPCRHETNFEQWVTNRFGRRLYRTFFKTYTEKVWGMSCKEISADWAAQRIKNLSLTEALRNAISSRNESKNGELITTLIERFHYPRLGPGMMWEACQDKLADARCPTLLGHRVERIAHRAGRLEHVVVRTADGERLEVEAGRCISTMPLRELIFALDPAPPEDVLQAAAELRYRDYLTVVLVVDRPDVFPDNWIYVHAPEVKLGRIQNYKNWSAAMVPDPDCTALGLEYFLWDRDEEWGWSDDRLIELGLRETERIGLVRPGEVRDGTVVRMPKAYPVYDRGYQQRLDYLRAYLDTFENLQTIGRNGLHRYNNQDHSMLTGVYAARNLMGEQHDVWCVNTEPEYHETQKAPPKESRLYPSVLDSVAGDDERADAEQALAPLDATALGLSVGVVAGVLLALGTAWLLLRGGTTIGPHLSLLGNYLLGYKVSWLGVPLGLLEAGVAGFCLGNLIAKLRNWSISAYLSFIRHVAD